MFDLENEKILIENPRWLCEECGFANVKMIVIQGKPAAKCTNCGAGYIETEGSA